MDDIAKQILDLVEERNPDNPLQYVKSIVQEMSCNKVCEHILNCRDCEMHCDFRELPHGNPNASVMIIGSSPEDVLIENQLALNYGESKRVLDIILDSLNVNKEEIFYASCIACSPQKNLSGKLIKRMPNTSEVKNCQVFVKSLIDIVDPLVIILMGPLAYNTFRKDGTLINNRGEWFEFNDIPVIATYSPSYFANAPVDEMTLQEQKSDFVNDIESAINYIRENYKEINL